MTEYTVKTGWIHKAEILFFSAHNSDEIDIVIGDFVARMEEFTESIIDFQIESHQLPGGCIDHAIEGAKLVPKKATKVRFRYAIFSEWNHECAYCGEHADTLDHVLARSKGGLTVKANLVPACRRCNGLKSDSTWDEWLKEQEWYAIEREVKIKDWIE